ncbi:MAG: hypothetical protein OXE94_13740 [Aestuariivita sp.]|nr:hypothetical protein [Aestuariivita sp.]MCY4203003.1 hypothetical protein [Aestuariivita sp.]
MSRSTLDLADDLLIVFVDDETLQIPREPLGPVAIRKLTDRKGRYYVSDIVKVI